MKNNIKDNENIVNYPIKTTKHFALKYMRKWDWDYEILRQCLQESEIVQVGKNKYEAHMRRKGSKKLIFSIQEEEIIIISGAQGK